MLLDWVSATAGPAATLLGGLMGRSAQKKQARLAEQGMRDARHQFQQQMDHSVRRRVEDAKRAGVHPLFAMGASVGASPTISGGDVRPPSGSAMGDAVARMGEQLGMVAQNRAAARRDEAEAMLMDSQRKRVEQDLASQGHDSQAIHELNVVPKVRGTVFGKADYVRPQVSQSQRTGVEAGTHPGKVEYVDQYGHKWTLPSQNLGLDEINQVYYAMHEIERTGRLTRRKIEQLIQDVAQKRRRQEREKDPATDWISP